MATMFNDGDRGTEIRRKLNKLSSELEGGIADVEQAVIDAQQSASDAEQYKIDAEGFKSQAEVAATNAANDVRSELEDVRDETEGFRDDTALIKSDFEQAFGGLSYLAPVEYTSGIEIDSAVKTVEYDGEVYAPLPSEVPFTTSGTFETDKFRIIQGVTTQQMASTAAGGFAANIGRNVIAVDSIADLLALPPGARRGDLRYLVLGQESDEGAGGREVYWDNSSTDPDDGTTTYEVPGVPVGRFKVGYRSALSVNLKTPGFPAIVVSAQQELDDRGGFNVRRVGVVENANVDNTAKLNYAFEVARDLGGKFIQLPAGIIDFEGTLGETVVSSSDRCIGISGVAARSTTLRCQADVAIRAIDFFNNWQYAMRLENFSLTSAFDRGDPNSIIPGSVGIHIERHQRNGEMRNVEVNGFDTGIDIGVHAQFIKMYNLSVALNGDGINFYGNYSDHIDLFGCVFTSNKRRSVIISSPRIAIYGAHFGRSQTFSDGVHPDIQIGYQNLREEDFGKSASLIGPESNSNAPNVTIVRPMFERHSNHQQSFIQFKDIDPSSGLSSPALIDSPVFANQITDPCIEVFQRRSGIVVRNPAGTVLNTLLGGDGSGGNTAPYVRTVGGTLSRNNIGLYGMYRQGNALGRLTTSRDLTDPTLTVTALGDSVIERDDETKTFYASKGGEVSNSLFTFSPGVPDAPGDILKMRVQGDFHGLSYLQLRVFHPPSTGNEEIIFEMEQLTRAGLNEGVVLEVPVARAEDVRVIVSRSASQPGEVVFQNFTFGYLAASEA